MSEANHATGTDFLLREWHVAGLLEQAARRHPERPFVVGATTLTYAEAFRRTQQIARWMRAQGVGRGDRVVILARNRPETALMAFATAQLGAIFVVLHHQMKPYGLEQILGVAEPRLVALDEAALELVETIGSRPMLFLGEDAGPDGATRLDDVLAAPAGEPVRFPGLDVDAVSLIFTSGSTGTPRGVVLTHDNIRFVVAAIQERLQYRVDDTVGIFLPLSFDYGLYQLFLAAQVGAAVFIGRPEMVGPELLRVLDAQKVTVLPGVPTLFAAMLKMLARRPAKLPSLRAVTNTGDRLPRAHVQQIRELLPDVRVYLMFGLTECKRVSIMLPGELDAHPDAVGRALTGTEVRVVGEDGQPLPPGETGEIVVRGRHVALGYWRAEAETRQRFRQELAQSRELWSGDYGSMDADGFIYFHGRKDALIKHRGFRISPLEIEEAACHIAGVTEAGVVQSEADGKLHLYVALNDSTLQVHVIVDGLRERLEPVKVPDEVHVIEALPKTQNRKIDRKLLKAQLAESAAR